MRDPGFLCVLQRVFKHKGESLPDQVCFASELRNCVSPSISLILVFTATLGLFLPHELLPVPQACAVPILGLLCPLSILHGRSSHQRPASLSFTCLSPERTPWAPSPPVTPGHLLSPGLVLLLPGTLSSRYLKFLSVCVMFTLTY